MRFFNPFAEIRVTRHNLPHWQQPGAAYFITFRMADSLPDEILRGLDLERRRWLETHPSPLSFEDEAEFHRLFSAQVDQWLDEGHGSCVLRQPLLRTVVNDALKFFHRHPMDG